jgi:hypothetical protein
MYTIRIGATRGSQATVYPDTYGVWGLQEATTLVETINSTGYLVFSITLDTPADIAVVTYLDQDGSAVIKSYSISNPTA